MGKSALGPARGVDLPVTPWSPLGTPPPGLLLPAPLEQPGSPRGDERTSYFAKENKLSMEPIRFLEQVSACMPAAAPAEVFRMAMLLCHANPQLDLDDEAAQLEMLDRQIRELTLQLALHEDQHAAIAEDLECLASTEPCQFSVQHLWTLIRAIKVQSQLLNLYLGPDRAATPATVSS